MTIPQKLDPSERGGEALNKKINEIISYLNHEAIPPVLPKRSDSPTESSPITYQHAEPQMEWRPMGIGDKFWMPPTGWRNAENRIIAGIVPLDQVPPEVVAKYKEKRNDHS